MSFPELIYLENRLPILQKHARVEVAAQIHHQRESYPIYTFVFGNQDPIAPTLALIGGVHGQEKIGTQVILSFLETLTELLEWDQVVHDYLKKIRIAVMPIVNPTGMHLLTRHNYNRVDLMRNSPQQSTESAFLLGGQRISPYLPWYQGKKGGPMEVESQALCDFVRKEVFSAQVSIALDCHSGYGSVDRLWFPYSYTRKAFPHLAEAYALKELLDDTYPNHVYHIEPGSQSYLISGDIWDYLYEEHRNTKQGLFLPMTLEMGSWVWLKKNPIQLFSSMGLFHPMHLHRHKRILRRHITLLDFLQRAIMSPYKWAKLEENARLERLRKATEYWYE